MNTRHFFHASALVTLGLFFPACGGAESEIVSDDVLDEESVPVNMGLGSFAILGNAAVTCTGGSVDGSVGTNLAPTAGSVTACAPTVGAVHVGDVIAKAAFDDFLNRYDALVPKAGQTCTVLTGTLAGITLPPGNYCFPAAATLTGVLTLQGPATGKWLFRVGTSGTGALTGTNFTVAMTGGAKACNVRWWVSQAATMTTSTFKGKILAGAAITLTGGSMKGNAWAKADATNTGAAIAGCLP